jgi:hypothetical protein
MQELQESKRIRALTRQLVAMIPRFPNNKTSLAALKGKSLTDLLITYIGWRLRYVARRPREVRGRANLNSDPRLPALKANIDAFVTAVEAGDDLTPYLSLDPHTRGYTPAADPTTRSADSWADKDFLLNVMGLHHFHLGLTREAAGHMARTNEVLFASVTRSYFEVLGLFDHDVFEHEEDGSMTPERTKLWTAFQARQVAGLLPGQLSMGGAGSLGITLSSHPVAVVRTAQRHVRIMREIDPKLDDRDYVRSLYQAQVPAKPRLRWHYNHLDFGLADDAASFFGVCDYGPN